jgi:hypothetical protein
LSDLDARLRGTDSAHGLGYLSDTDGFPEEQRRQLHRSVDALGKLALGLLPSKREDLKRLIDKQKN